MNKTNILKKYKSYESDSRFGIRCAVNRPTDRYPLHRHDYFEFEIIRKGSIRHELNGVVQTLIAGDAYAVSPKELHRFTVLKDVEICSLCISYADAPQSIQRLISTVKYPLCARLSSEEAEQIFQLFDSITADLKSTSEYARALACAHTSLFLVSFFEHSETQGETAVSNGFSYVARAMEYISENLSAQITLDEVAREVHLTPNYFSKLFARINGRSFLSYLNGQRIECAKSLLISTEMQITEIAFACGFGSFSGFSRAFKSECGCTPREFRERSEKGEDV